MISLLLIIGLAITPGVLAQNTEENTDTLYYKIKDLVELEIREDEAELAIEEFATGVYYDKPLRTVKGDGANRESVELNVKPEFVDMSLQKAISAMCGDDSSDEDVHNEYITCVNAQGMLNSIVDRNTWHRSLGRQLQAIASGYEVGIEGYPGKPVDAIMRMSSIAQLWRASNDLYTQPFLETLTRAEPWPEEQAETIEQELQEVVNTLIELIRESGEDEDIKEDDAEMVAAVWRYKDGVNYVLDREGGCDDNVEPDDMSRYYLDNRWCDIEEKLLNVLNDTILANADLDVSNDEFVIFPSYVDKESNIFIWIRDDDIGLQWYVPLEPVQAILHHPRFAECLEEQDPKSCYTSLGEEFLVRGGQYPMKHDGTDRRPGEAGLFPGDVVPPRESDEDDEGNPLPPEGMIVPQPKENEGICSHPFSQRGYLCRAIESEACDLTEKDNDELIEAGTGGIVLTRCQPERFKDDVARRVSGEDICGVGGWRETVEENLVSVEDTPEIDEEIEPNGCSACAIDIVCKENCYDDPDQKGASRTASAKRDGVIEVCVSTATHTGTMLYVMAHELIHAQQMCNDSNIQTAERIGHSLPKNDKPAACCALEREAYFVSCKMAALDGVLDKAGLSIDQCASALANFSCSGLDDDPDDDDYVCTNDSVDPDTIFELYAETIAQMVDEGTVNLPDSCEDAMKDDHILSIKNSLPLACRPGCQSKYTNTIGNNLCYTGQCLEETHEWSAPIGGRSALTTVDEAYPWNSCEETDPLIGQFAVPPAITAPRFPLYRPELLMKQLDDAVCQLNGLPSQTPPALCTGDGGKTLNLPPLNFFQTGDNIATEPDKYNVNALGLQYAAEGIGARVANEIFTQYLRVASKNFAELLNMSHRLFSEVGEISFPSTMCPRYIEGDLCSQLQ